MTLYLRLDRKQHYIILRYDFISDQVVDSCSRSFFLCSMQLNVFPYVLLSVETRLFGSRLQLPYMSCITLINIFSTRLRLFPRVHALLLFVESKRLSVNRLQLQAAR